MQYLKSFRFGFLALGLTSTLLACGQGQTDSTPRINDSNSRLPIDNAIVGQARQYVQEHLQRLPEDRRENVVVVSPDGEIFSNRMELQAQTETVQRSSINGLNQLSTDQSFAMPALTDKPKRYGVSAPDRREVQYGTGVTAQQAGDECSSTTGYFTRTYAYPGYAFLSADITPPGGANVVNLEKVRASTSADTPFIYSGGWGQLQGNVDAGFKHNVSDDSWQPVIQSALTGVQALPYRFAPNRGVHLEFYVYDTDQVAIYVAGYQKNGSYIAATLIKDERGRSPGWNLDGTMVVIKRMTSIAQRVGFNTKYSGAAVRNAAWRYVKIGNSISDAHLYQYSDNAGFCDYTVDVAGATFQDWANQGDSVVLFPPQ